MVRIAHGLFTWQAGRPALEACLLSTAGVVDEVIIADGLIDGVPDLGLPALSDLSWLQDADYLPPRVPVNAKRWSSLSAACNWILATARQLEVDWILYVDDDHELHNPAALRSYLENWPGIAFPIPRQDQRRHLCPWQCIRVDAFTRYLAGCFVLETTSGAKVSLVTSGGPEESRFEWKGMPWLSHHHDRLPPWRRAHRLGHLETVLEPPPIDALETVDLPLPGVDVVSVRMSETDVVSGAPAWYCDQCGTRYYGPGLCSNQHPPRELQLDESTPGAAAQTEPASDTTAAAPEEPTVATVDSPPLNEAAGDTTVDEDQATDASPPAPEDAPSEPVPATPPPADPLGEAETAAQEAHSLLQQAVDLLHAAAAKLTQG